MTETQIIQGNTILKKMHVFQLVVTNKCPLKIEPSDQSECVWDEVQDFKKQADEAWKKFAQQKLDELQKELEAL